MSAQEDVAVKGEDGVEDLGVAGRVIPLPRAVLTASPESSVAATVLAAPPGEAAKAAQLGRTPDPERLALAYVVDDADGVEGLQRRADAAYRFPTLLELQRAHAETIDWMRSGNVRAILPLRERERTLDETLRHLVALLPAGAITVMDAGSSAEALAPVRERAGHVMLVNQDDVLSTIRWDALLPILHLTERPRGKGTTLLALFLWEKAVQEARNESQGQGSVIFQTDTDITLGYGAYNPLIRLLYPFVTERRSVLATKTAMGGRGNETVMAARTALQTLAQSPAVREDVRARLRFLFEALTAHKWMLTGELAFTDGTAFRRPVATGYLDETVAAIAMEDASKGTQRRVLHVGNPSPRLDLPNDADKEATMMQMITKGLLTIALFGVPLTHLSIEQMGELNRQLAESHIVGLIPAPPEARQDDQVQLRRIRQDRIFPSVLSLIEQNWVDMAALKRLVERTLS